MTLQFTLRSRAWRPDMHLFSQIRSESVLVHGTNTFKNPVSLPAEDFERIVEVEYRALSLAPGNYQLRIGVRQGLITILQEDIPFEVLDLWDATGGLVRFEHWWRVLLGKNDA